MESFFTTLRTERTARKLYRTRDEARADVFDSIERFFNPRKRHSRLGYLSPIGVRGTCHASLTCRSGNRQQIMAVVAFGDRALGRRRSSRPRVPRSGTGRRGP